MKKLLEMIYGREYELRERIFRVITLIGYTMAFLGIVECIALMDFNIILLPLTVLFVVMLVALIATFRYRRLEFASILVGVLIILVIFPEMFFLSGGLDGGATIWFVLGMFYVFLMFTGKRLIFFVTFSVIMDSITYFIGYNYPDLVTPMESRAAAFTDSFFAVLIVGLAGGVILKAQMRMFNVENAVAKRQQKELENAGEAKNRFFASMSHEIRTPINTIVGLNEMILRESSESGIKDYAGNIQSASKMLLSLVNDILDLSQLEMKKMEIIPMEYGTVQLFGDLIDVVQVRMKEKKLEFLVDIDENIPSVFLGDVKRITQVVLNILTNAVKYTNEGTVTLSAGIDIPEQSTLSNGTVINLKIVVSDTGIGIRKEDLENLYDIFKRVDAKKNLRVEGSGLGLSITKQLVDMMDGEISVDSIYTKGTIFTITLPQLIVDASPIGNVRFLSRNRSGAGGYRQLFEAPEARVLIVDDNEMNSMVATKLLSATKLQIDVAKSGMECLEMAKIKYYHVILMDYMMPDMDGGETLKQLRRQKNCLCRDSAVIVLSANTVSESAKIMEDNGFDGLLEKPIQGDLLEAEILKFLPDDIVEYRLKRDGMEGDTEIQKISRRKKKKIYITTDCVSDLPDKYIDKYDIGIMYMYIKTDSGRFADTLEISSDSLNRFMTEESSGAFSDGVSVEEYEEFFADTLTKADHVIHIALARNAGQSYNTAVKAARGFDHVHVIDSMLASGGQGLVVLYAAKLAMEGCRVNDICEKVDIMKKHIVSHYILPSANIFNQHGYMNKNIAKVCEMLSLHPVLKIRQSRMVMSGIRAGSLTGACKRFIHWHLMRKGRVNDDVVFITHVGCTVEQQNFIRNEILRCIPFKKVIMQRASFTTACNTGIGAFGFAYYVNVDDSSKNG